MPCSALDNRDLSRGGLPVPAVFNVRLFRRLCKALMGTSLEWRVRSVSRLSAEMLRLRGSIGVLTPLIEPAGVM